MRANLVIFAQNVFLLQDDITKQNTDVYKRSLRWLNALEDLIESVQVNTCYDF